MGWHFRAGERLASVLIPSKRDARAGNSQVLERIGIYHLGKLSRDGIATLVLTRMVMSKSQRREVLISLGMALIDSLLKLDYM